MQKFPKYYINSTLSLTEYNDEIDTLPVNAQVYLSLLLCGS